MRFLDELVGIYRDCSVLTVEITSRSKLDHHCKPESTGRTLRPDNNFNEEASFLGQYSGNRAISKKSIHHMKEASPELSTIGIFNTTTTNTTATTTTTTNTSDNSDLLHHTAAMSTSPNNQPIHFITRENHQTAV
ncbi:unnamed protein product [Schistosoma curassoni]|uniref:MEIS N-terminal domain-containing protein n=1 Tax=Schistosoma curassoni TaxID=6186 RepID=A0A183K1I5_9TREM|nr:unnamed protein product [Schistosoma curassoni]